MADLPAAGPRHRRVGRGLPGPTPRHHSGRAPLSAARPAVAASVGLLLVAALVQGGAASTRSTSVSAEGLRATAAAVVDAPVPGVPADVDDVSPGRQDGTGGTDDAGAAASSVGADLLPVPPGPPQSVAAGTAAVGAAPGAPPGAVGTDGRRESGTSPAAGATGSATGTPRTDDAGCVPAPLAERAAAVLVVGLPGITGADEPLAREVVELGVGGVFLSSANVRTATQTTDLVAGLQRAMEQRHERPLVVSTDEESGRVALARQVVGAGPSPRRLAQSRTPQEVEAFAADSGARLAELGVTLNLAPVLDLDDGPADGVIGDRAFGAEPEVVTEYAAAYWRGLASSGVTPTAKHFPGHGRSATDTHARGDVVEASLGELLRTDLVPFAHAIEDGVPVIMLNHLGYRALDPELPASLSPAAYAALREMGFRGVAMTDSLGMGAVHRRWDFPESVVLAVAAGADAALTTDGTRARAMRDALVDAVRTGRLDEDRLSEAAARVTALGGGDPVAMSCLDVALPDPDALPASTPGGEEAAAPVPDPLAIR
nr:glycoside hydrolase family 3 N-terminal domain-containing protein [uncultured Actinotalea sp.]